MTLGQWRLLYRALIIVAFIVVPIGSFAVSMIGRGFFGFFPCVALTCMALPLAAAWYIGRRFLTSSPE